MAFAVGKDAEAGYLAREVADVLLGVTVPDTGQDERPVPYLPDDLAVNAHARPRDSLNDDPHGCLVRMRMGVGVVRCAGGCVVVIIAA